MGLWTAFLVGLVGSLHCLGMCGPIALSLPISSGSGFKKSAHKLIYNSGRVITYSFLGLLLGIVGEGFTMAGFQQGLSIGVGVMMLLGIIIYSYSSKSAFLLKPIYTFTGYLKKGLSGRFKSRSATSLFIIGLLNGFLPCGLVYVALAGALTTGGIKEGVIYMVFFGLGTIPMMFAVSSIWQFFPPRIKTQIPRLIPTFVIILGILFILRGLNLGIPYVSPKLIKEENKEEMQVCHTNSANNLDRLTW